MMWRQIPGYEGLYEVSDTGLVKSCRTGKLRVYSKNRQGYFTICLWREGQQTGFAVHKIVALAFHGNPKPGQEVCHNDGDKINNSARNIRWDTRSANRRDAVSHGTHYSTAKTHCPYGHPLSGENLVPSKLKLGIRNCLECSRSRYKKLEGSKYAYTQN